MRLSTAITNRDVGILQFVRISRELHMSHYNKLGARMFQEVIIIRPLMRSGHTLKLEMF